MLFVYILYITEHTVTGVEQERVPVLILFLFIEHLMLFTFYKYIVNICSIYSYLFYNFSPLVYPLLLLLSYK